MIVSYVTKLNTRRGGESARMKVKDWTERDSWLSGSKGSKDEVTVDNKRNYSVNYIMGKENSLVSFALPKCYDTALNLLSDNTVRKRAGISILSSSLTQPSTRWVHRA